MTLMWCIIWTGEGERPLNLLRAGEAAGNPDRVYLFGSTSKMTFAGAGIGFMASSVGNVKYLLALVNTNLSGLTRWSSTGT
jgi:DNA-binding transcriptional MocR family regulator